MTKITLYYDCVSPYSWLAFEFLLKYQKAWNYELVLKPVFLGAIMKASENTPPGLIPNKGRWMIKDLHRWSQLYGFPLKRHPDFGKLMFESIKPMRLVTCVQMHVP